jgi:hypothetical protein
MYFRIKISKIEIISIVKKQFLQSDSSVLIFLNYYDEIVGNGSDPGVSPIKNYLRLTRRCDVTCSAVLAGLKKAVLFPALPNILNDAKRYGQLPTGYYLFWLNFVPVVLFGR